MNFNWRGCAVHSECTLHQISPYIGKIKSSFAAQLIETFAEPGQTIYDPFCGSGGVLLEAWAKGCSALGNDLSPYARLITKAKLFPPRSVFAAMQRISEAAEEVSLRQSAISIGDYEPEIKRFFHPKTFQEILAWVSVLSEWKEDFLLAALMGILHHQRPGFLSYPSSHTVPYLRSRLFPKRQFPEMYHYRPVRVRLEKKIHRALKRVPDFDRKLYRGCVAHDAATFIPARRVDGIITSPPYMRQLDYGRDNRLRLWFLGVNDWKGLDSRVSPSETEFLDVIRKCLRNWKSILSHDAWCILVLGDSYARSYQMPLPDAIRHIALNEVKGFRCEWNYTDHIPALRRVRREFRGNSSETILALRVE